MDAEIASMAAHDESIVLCATVPGVGAIVAAIYISVLDDAGRFRNGDAVASYFGLAPSEATTGGPQNRRLGGITKQGNTHARAMLVQAAWQIMRVGGASDPLRTWAKQVANRRGKKVAAIALARKLAAMLWAMCRDGTVYDPAFVARSSTKGLGKSAQQRELVAKAMAKVARTLALRSAPLARQKKQTAKKKLSPEATV